MSKFNEQVAIWLAEKEPGFLGKTWHKLVFFRHNMSYPPKFGSYARKLVTA